MKNEELIKIAGEHTGISHIGLLKKSARIKQRMGSDVSDILGWDVITKGENQTCYSFYSAQPPLIGLTQPQPVECPVGIIAFDTHKIDIEEAIKIFHTQLGGDKFTQILLCWPLAHPEPPEPYWYFKTNLGTDVVIGANSGQIKGYEPLTILYMAQHT